uniref:Secreted protein n=1 Tax=Achlya hypogyna TaxID=1202772 RepID=A0A0A7CNE2_ACHHY|nr:secreted protein [Achlya hypogyna]
MSRQPLACLILLGAAWLCEGACPVAPGSGRICNGHGDCTPLGECQCHSSAFGFDCSQHKPLTEALVYCPRGPAWAGDAIGIDQIHVLAECSNQGTCDRSNGRCACENGFTGKDCSKLACFSACSNSGRCVSMKEYAETKSPYGFTYTTVWDAQSIRGCCHPEIDMLLELCPVGDDPMTMGQVNEMQLLRCTGTGSFQLQFNGQITRPIPSTATAAQLTSLLQNLGGTGALAITYSSGTQLCDSTGANIVSIEFREFAVQQPRLLQFSYDDNVSSLSNTAPVTGVCSCYLYPMPGYRSSDGYGREGLRGDCGAPDNRNFYGGPIAGCPGYLPCSGHGMCTGSPAYACKCAAGWTSGDCSLRTCPLGYSWFNLPSANNIAHQSLVACSNAGECDPTSGRCECFAPFTGAACEFSLLFAYGSHRLSVVRCPQGPDNVAPCAKHGVCLTLSELAAATTIDGVPAQFTYGATPNNPLTWDALKIQGCKCDAGFGGHDCSLRLCPTGDDPVTTGQVDAVQRVQCTAIGGIFQLGFRGFFTDALAFNAPVGDVADALLRLPTVHGIDVVFTQSGACTGGNTMTITFTQDFGNLPTLQFVSDMLAATAPASVTTIVVGTKEEAVCSNHGTCDTTRGVCVCGVGYTSSDGVGGPGNRGDCGYLNPLIH